MWVVLAVAILYFLGRSLAANWIRLDMSLADVRWSWLVASAAVFAAAYALTALLWRQALAIFDARLGRGAAYEIVVLAQLAKYLPGALWAVVGQVELTKRAGVRRSVSLSAVGIMSVAVILSGLTFGLIAGAPVAALGRGRIVAAVVGVAVLGVCMHPAVFGRAVRASFVIAGREPPPMSLSTADTVKLVVVAFAYWPVAGLGFYLMVGAVTSVSWTSALTLAAAYAVSWTIGYVAIFAPGGIGVREGIMVLLLRPVMSEPAAILVSLAQRVWFTVMELVLALGVLATRRLVQRL